MVTSTTPLPSSPRRTASGFNVGHDDAVDSGPDRAHNSRPLLSELASPQKPPATYIRGSMILDHMRTRFLGGDLYARVTYTRVYTVNDLAMTILAPSGQDVGLCILMRSFLNFSSRSNSGDGQNDKFVCSV